MVQHCFSLIFLFYFIKISWAFRDTIPPTGHLISPRSHTLISQNFIRFVAEVQDSGSGVKSVVFNVNYMGYVESKDHMGRVSQAIGHVDHPPYEFLWDCSGIPDQDHWRMKAGIDVQDRAGNISYEAGGTMAQIVLDRNALISNKKVISNRTFNPIKIDGYFQDWIKSSPLDTITFINSDNQIRAVSLWDVNFLYFFIYVFDEKVYSQYDSARVNGPEGFQGSNHWIFQDDAIEIFIDGQNERREFPDTNDRQLLVAAAGACLGYNMYPLDQMERLKETDCAVRVQGLLNEDNGADTGYFSEIAFAWSDLKLKPKQGLTLGFDLSNIDKETNQGMRTGLSWVGNVLSNYNNPSEWGILVLEDQRKRIGLWWIAIILIAGILSYIKIKSRRDHNLNSEENLSATSLRLKKFVQENFQDSELSLDKAATGLGLSSRYVSRIFKKELKINFTNYVNKVRIEKAKEILLNFNQSITDIAFDVGYGNLNHFERIFKKYEKITPKEYRLRILKKKN